MIEPFMDMPALSCTFNLHDPHKNKDHSLNVIGSLSFSGGVKLPEKDLLLCWALHSHSADRASVRPGCILGTPASCSRPEPSAGRSPVSCHPSRTGWVGSL